MGKSAWRVCRAPGTEVEVTISPKWASGSDFAAAWRRLCDEWRSRPGLRHITDEQIGEEIDRHRAGE